MTRNKINLVNHEIQFPCKCHEVLIQLCNVSPTAHLCCVPRGISYYQDRLLSNIKKLQQRRCPEASSIVSDV